MLQTLIFMQDPLQHLACESSNTVVWMSCLGLAFIEFKTLLLQMQKSV